MLFLPAYAETLTIATVNNGDMVRMKSLSEAFTQANPDIELEWVVLEENALRQRVTSQIVTQDGNFDVLTMGTYEVPIWAQKNWLLPLNDLGPGYDMNDLLPPIREGLSLNKVLYAAPFYGESSFVMYRSDLFQKAGLTMPQEPSWAFIADAAQQLADKNSGVHGICLRGLAGWGQNLALITAMSNSFGARWFDMNWVPQFKTTQWRQTLDFYIDMLRSSGPKNASRNGFNVILALFQQGRCAIWIDATVAASFVTDPEHSVIADHVGFAMAPDAGLGKRANWLWAWALAIPSSSDSPEAARRFIAWATSSAYTQLVVQQKGWAAAPPGTRSSLYRQPQYLRAAPFAAITLRSIEAADPNNPAVDPVPYKGVQFVAIPEFQYVGTTVAQVFAAALDGKISTEEALDRAQNATVEIMRAGGYIVGSN